jgi:hypothetical protein
MSLQGTPSPPEFQRWMSQETVPVKKNYVLIDYENVQPDALEALEADHFNVLVFVGASQSKVTYEVASSLQRLGERASYIKISGNGSNALDFHIAYYIGKLAEREPDAYFHIVSKDTGFDPLLQHLKSRKVLASRVKAISDLPIVKIAASKSLPDRVSAVISNLAQRKASNPRTLKTLSSTINALFQKALSPAEIDSIISELTKQGVITVNQTKVAYDLPSAI